MGYICSGGAATRREWLSSPEGGGQLKAEVAAAAPANPLAAMDTMKLQVVNQGVFLGLFYAIQVGHRGAALSRALAEVSPLLPRANAPCFRPPPPPPSSQNVLAGFLVVKMPFSLTERFKSLTQQGIGVAALDTSYVSSGSWYMIAQQGLTRALQLIDAGSVVSEAQVMQMQMGPMGGGAGGAPWNAKQVFASEASALAVTKYHSALSETERELIDAARVLPPRRRPARA